MSEILSSRSSGFLYYSVGDAYRQKGLQSLTSLRTCMPDAIVQVHTDRPDLFANLADITVQEESKYSKAKRIELMHETPFTETIFIDSDTFVVRACAAVFNLLKSKELALAHTVTKPGVGQDKIPDSFCGFNSGIFAYSKTQQTMKILREWHSRFIAYREIDAETGDEVPLRSVMYENPVDMAVLPSHYNFRIAQPQVVYGPTSVSILHGHTDNYQEIVDQLYSGPDPLLYIPPQS